MRNGNGNDLFLELVPESFQSYWTSCHSTKREKSAAKQRLVATCTVDRTPTGSTFDETEDESDCQGPSTFGEMEDESDGQGPSTFGDMEDGSDRQGPSTSKDPWPFLSEFFLFVSSTASNIEYRCKLCPAKAGTIKTSRSSKSNLSRHVKRLHRSRMDAFKGLLQRSKWVKNPHSSNSEQMSIESFVQRTAGHVTQEIVDDKIVKFIIRSAQPFMLVREPSFVDLLQTLQPGKNVMCYRTLMKMLKQKFMDMRRQMKMEFGEVKYICVTGDVWTTGHRTFLGMTAHILTTHLERKSYAIACSRVRDSLTYDVLTKVVLDILEQYNIEFKVVGMVTDNGTNFVKAFRLFEQDHDTENEDESSDEDEDGDESRTEDDKDEDDVMVDLDAILLSGSEDPEKIALPPHYRCAAHTLNLVASKDAELTMKDDRNYVRAERSFFKKAQTLWNLYGRSSKFAANVEKKFQLHLITPVVTRWNSRYDSVKRLQKLYEQSPEDLQSLFMEAKSPPLTADDVAFMNEYITAMEPIAIALDFLQGDKYTYLGYLIPTLKSVQQHLEERKERLVTCRSVVDTMLSALKRRFQSQLESRNAVVAAVYIPEFKLDFLADETDNDDRITKSKAKDWLLAEMIVLDGSQSGSGETVEEERGSSFFVVKKQRRKESVEDEMYRYLADQSSDLDSIRNYKRVMQVFLKLNTMLPTSASVEHLFSKGRDVFRYSRRTMSDQNFEIQLLLNANSIL